jgi:anti-sigma factor RsiW
VSDCERIRELLPLAAADALSDSERADVERHVSTCVHCAAELRTWTALSTALARLPDPQLPPVLLYRASASEGPWLGSLAILAAILGWLFSALGWWVAGPAAFFTGVVVSWVCAGVAAILLRQSRAQRRLYEPSY